MTDGSDEILQSPRAGFGAALALILATAAAVAVAQVALSPRDEPVEVRFCNLTQTALGNVVTSGWRLGDIAPGQCSAFVRMPRGFSTMGFGATSQSRRYERWPEDHADARPLPAGRYTFLIETTPDGLTDVLMNE